MSTPAIATTTRSTVAMTDFFFMMFLRTRCGRGGFRVCRELHARVMKCGKKKTASRGSPFCTARMARLLLVVPLGPPRLPLGLHGLELRALLGGEEREDALALLGVQLLHLRALRLGGRFERVE